MTVPTTLRIRRPDDWHLHLRDGELMAAVLPYTSAVYGRAIVMPNLAPPVTTVAAAAAYRRRILDALPAGQERKPRAPACAPAHARRPKDRPGEDTRSKRGGALPSIRTPT